MKRLFYILFFSIFTFVMVHFLNQKNGVIPPMGKFLDPFHGFWQNSERFLFDTSSVLISNHLVADAELIYDSLLIPHIFAQNNHDLYFLQGYVTARHRLWQMEFQTIFAAGRLSEVFGMNPRILEADRRHRRIGLGYGAEKALEEAMQVPEAKEMVEAYTKGINVYIDQLKEAQLPVEYKFFDYKPEPWTPLKTMLLLKYMANNLAGHDYDLENTNAFHVFGDSTFRALYPIRDHGIDPVAPPGTEWNFKPLAFPKDSITAPPLAGTFSLSKPDPDNGSNNWAVSGEKTASGYPILAGDPHLSLSLPSIWFAIQLHSPDVHVMGASLPGSPGVIIGFNDSIAWSVTNSRRDVRDWYKIEYTDNSKSEYRYGDQTKPTSIRIEEIKIRDEASFFDTVYYTHYGPVVYDSSFPANEQLESFALRWVAHDPSGEMYSFYRLNRAKNYNKFREALESFDCPAQNFAFASKNGDIAVVSNGKFPLKKMGQGMFLMDGSQPENEWLGFIPHKQNVVSKNPPRNFVSSANQIPADSTYPYFIYDGSYEHYRNRRINEKLEDLHEITPNDMMALQNDNYNLKAAESLPVMLSGISRDNLDDHQTDYLDRLDKWNYFNDANKIAPAIYDVWYRHFNDTLWDEMESDSISIRNVTDAQTIYIINHYTDYDFYDNKKSSEKETLTDLLTGSFIKACNQLDQWQIAKDIELTWGNYKNTSIRHLIPQFSSFGFHGIQIGGGRHIVNATAGNHGPSWRMVVELGPETKAWAVYPGGQSGNPGSIYYGNLVNNWAIGNPLPLSFFPNTDIPKKQILFRQTLKTK